MAIDRVTLEILADHSRAAAESMGYTLFRTAHSAFVCLTSAPLGQIEVIAVSESEVSPISMSRHKFDKELFSKSIGPAA